MSTYSIRRMEKEDIDEVTEIDVISFTSPWTRKIFEQEIMYNRHAHYFVLVEGREIVGYVGLWVVEEDAQVTNIAILPSYRGKKLGEKLFTFAMNYAVSLGALRLSLEVRVSNYVAQNMYKKFGLVPGGVRKAYYPDNREDAIVMWVKLC